MAIPYDVDVGFMVDMCFVVPYKIFIVQCLVIHYTRMKLYIREKMSNV